MRYAYFLLMIMLFGCVPSLVQREVVKPPDTRDVTADPNTPPFPPRSQIIVNYDNSLDGQLDSLARQVSMQLSRGTLTHICIKGFFDVKGRTRRLEKYLEMEFTNRLIRTGLFQIYAPEELEKLEPKMPSPAEDFPNAWENKPMPMPDAPIDSILVGSTIDLPQSVKVTVKLVSSRTGAVFGAASVLLNKDSTVDELLRRPGTSVSVPWHNANYKTGDVIKVGENQFVELIPDEYALYVKQINFEFGLFTSNVSSAEIFLNNEYRVMRVDDMISLSYDNDKCVLALRHIMDRTATFTFACLAKGESAPTDPFSRVDAMQPRQDAPKADESAGQANPDNGKAPSKGATTRKTAAPNDQAKPDQGKTANNGLAAKAAPSSSARDAAKSPASTASSIDALENELSGSTLPPLEGQQ